MAESRTFEMIRIGLASPEEVRGWSSGEVKKPETINYRTFKPERDGLFCERIFGPVKDWECHCGRYKKVKFKGIICDRCGVEVTRSKVRRERMGHIELAAPVSHIWYLKGVPSPIAQLLDISPRPLEKVVYFGSYIVTHVDRKLIRDRWAEIENAVRAELQERQTASEEASSLTETLPIDNNEDEESLVGRIATEAVEDPETGKTLVEAGDKITQEDLESLSEAGIAELEVEVDAEETPVLVAAPRMLDEIAGDDLEAGLELLEKVEKKELLVEDQFRQIERVVQVLARRLGREFDGMFRAGLGATAVRELLQEIDLDALLRELETEIAQTQGPRRARAVKRIDIVKAFLESKSRPEWMILDAVPVIPPELRPMVQLDGGRFATSDLNDLYRRIINRNNRLKKIQDIKAPESIINHEKRLLQEAVDALIDNGRRTRPVVGSNNRPLRSLSDMLKGKEGRFRKNLLGKRVDYSGRSVIVVGPNLKLNQCGLPKEMALELFKPFVMKTLVKHGKTSNIKTAKRMIDRVQADVWDALEEVVQEHVVMLNRAPTLHRLGIQAFQPILVDGKAIRVHPLVCAAFGADFDGDQMAVHVPLSSMAQAEGQCLMLSTRNLFRPADGSPIVAPIQDIVLGLYYLTQQAEEGEPRVFGSPDEATLAQQAGRIHLHDRIRVRDVDPDDLVRRFREARPDATDEEIRQLDPTDHAPENADVRALAEGCRKKLYDTTPGRLILSQITPWMMRYPSEYNARRGRTYDKKRAVPGLGVVDVEMDKKPIAALVRYCYEDYGAQRTIVLLDDIKDAGFRWATHSGLSISITDMDEPEQRDVIIRRVEQEVADINQRYRRGAISAGERLGRVRIAWTGAATQIGNAILESIPNNNPIYMMTTSGARGSKTQITQLSGMRGLMSDPFGGLIEELPIKSNFHRGLNILEYFVSTHGQRKGLADTALRTADAGYLTRRLVDVAQDVIVRELDCGTTRGIHMTPITEAKDIIMELHERIRGRVALEDIVDPRPEARSDIVDEQTGEVIGQRQEVLVHANEEISDEQALAIQRLGINRVMIRSPFTCEARHGICATCYGRDMATQRPVEVGTAVGIIAAQSIGEPGTQLTMRTFHTGGVVGKNIVGVANVKQKKQEALRELHADIEHGRLQLTETTSSERERSRAVQAMLKVLEEQVGGLLRVVELVEARKPKGQAIITEVDGKVVSIEQKGSRRVIIHSKLRLDSGESTTGKVLGEPVILEEDLNLSKAIPDAAVFLEDIVDPSTGEVLASSGAEVDAAIAKTLVEAGIKTVPVRRTVLEAGTELNEKAMRQIRDKVEEITICNSHLVPHRGALEVQEGDELNAGDRLTEGPLDPDRLLELQGIAGVQDYMVKEVQRVYKSQGVDINDKHVEVIVRQMLRKRKILDPGDTLFLPGQMVDKFEFEDANAEVREKGGAEATADWLLLGITEASLATDSFLSAASFQKTTKVLAEAAVKGKRDNLLGLKENVIIGRLIPAGTGLDVYHRMSVGGEAADLVIPMPSHSSEEDIEQVLAEPLTSASLWSASERELASAGMQIADATGAEAGTEAPETTEYE